MTRSHRRRGFTLIELLIVIDIIAVLAAILLPVLFGARERAHQIVCLSNMRQISLACLQYSEDNDEMCVPENSPYIGNGRLHWTSLLVSYTAKSDRAGIFYCPSSGDPENGYFAPNPKYINTRLGQRKTTYCGVAEGDPSDDSFVRKPDRFSYSMNYLPSDGWHTVGWNNAGRFGYHSGTTNTGVSVSEAQVEDPSGTIQFFDAMCGARYTTPQTSTSNTCTSGNSSLIRLDDEYQTDRYPEAESVKPAYRHSGGFDALYGDGHAKYRKWGTTTPCEWSIQADPYPSDPPFMANACRGK